MGSAFGAIHRDEANRVDDIGWVFRISEIPLDSNDYFIIYDEKYRLAEGSINSIRTRLPEKYLNRTIKIYERNAKWPRVVTIRF